MLSLGVSKDNTTFPTKVVLVLFSQNRVLSLEVFKDISTFTSTKIVVFNGIAFKEFPIVTGGIQGQCEIL